MRIDVVEQLRRIERSGGNGTVRFADGRTLDVTSLGKRWFGEHGPTKGDVMRYYTRVAPVLLPQLADRPLVLHRFPNGIAGESFFQQNVTDATPDSVRIADVETGDGGRAARIVGGDLLTLLYTVQVGAIAVHAWLSRLSRIQYPEYSVIDLDPGEGVPFTQVVLLARSIADILRERGLHGAVKTSGSRGLHIALPLPRATSFEHSAALAMRIAERVAGRYPDTATVERRLRARPSGTIYVDAQQNAHGKSVVAAYSVRARPGAPVSTPLRWSELTRALRLESHTLRSVPRRIARVGDLWNDALRTRNAARRVRKSVEEDPAQEGQW